MAPELSKESAGLDAQTALLSSGHAFAVTDPRRPDNPLVWVNPAFERLTGYRSPQVVGRNCRLLQGSDTDPATVGRIRAALTSGRPVTETLLNYRPDGSPWWNQVTICPVRSDSGELTHFVAVQSDVSDRVHARAQRDDARAAVGRAYERLELLVEVGTMLAATLDPVVAAQRLTRLVVRDVADWASVLLFNADADPAAGGLKNPILTLAHRDRSRDEVVTRILAVQPATPEPRSPQAEVLRTGRPVLLPDLGGFENQTSGVEQLTRDWRELGQRSCLVLPLVARGAPIGCLTLVYSDSGRRYVTADIEFGMDLGRRAGMALDTVRLFSTEHATALALQRSLLPALPHIAGLETAARYLPGSDRAEIGGDWYDVLPLPDGSTGLAVGDVMGHDIHAAAAMGQLRSVLRSYAWEGHSPAGVVDRLNQLVCGLGMAELATCVYARIEPATDTGPAVLRWCNAGHPPPLLKTPDGVVHLLEAGSSALIGVNTAGHSLPSRPSGSCPLPPGSTLLLYTDGLIETRERDIDEGIAQLVTVFTAAAPETPLQSLADELVGAPGAGREDDRCLLLVRIT